MEKARQERQRKIAPTASDAGTVIAGGLAAIVLFARALYAFGSGAWATGGGQVLLVLNPFFLSVTVLYYFLAEWNIERSVEALQTVTHPRLELVLRFAYTVLLALATAGAPEWVGEWLGWDAGVLCAIAIAGVYTIFLAWDFVIWNLDQGNLRRSVFPLDCAGFVLGLLLLLLARLAQPMTLGLIGLLAIPVFGVMVAWHLGTKGIPNAFARRPA